MRLVEGLAESFDRTVLARRIQGGVEVSQVPRGAIRIITGPSSRVRFALAVAGHLAARTRAYDRVIVEGYGLAALAANLIGRFARVPVTKLVCNPVESYYRCRRGALDARHPYRPLALAGLGLLARANARLGRNYVVLSRYLEQVVRGHGTRAAVHVVPVYAVDTDLFRPSREPRHVLRAKLGLPHEEALACEVPVVATAVGGLRETIVDGVTGWTYPLGDAGALAAAMAALLDHPDEALRRTRAGRTMVMERFERRAVFG